MARKKHVQSFNGQKSDKKSQFRVFEEWVTSALDMPPDLNEAIPRIFWLGREQIHIDNHRGVVTFEPNCIRLMTRQGLLEIKGKKLELSCLSATEVEIVGNIQTVTFAEPPAK